MTRSFFRCHVPITGCVLISNSHRHAGLDSILSPLNHIECRWLFSVVNSDKQYLLHPFPLPPQNKHNAITSYERHNQLVRDTIPSTHLLEYNVVEGWEPLCHFLEIPDADCPSSQGIPFPKTNSALAVRWQSYSSFIGPLLLTVFVLYSLVSLIFQKVTGMTIVEWCGLQKSRVVHSARKSLEMRRIKWKSL
jgi:hypothetical protein